MDRKFTVGLAQMFPRLGDVQANLEHHLQLAREAQGLGVDLLIFPELSLTGYTLRELVPHVAIRPSAAHPIWKPLLEASADMALVVGFVEEDARHRFFASSAFLDGGRVVHIHRKVYLPTYGLFEEGRYLSPGDGFRAFDTRFGRCGMAICEDSWHISTPYLLWMDGADYLIFCSASPAYGVGMDQEGATANAATVTLFTKTYATLLTSYAFHVNRVGVEEGISFWGGSLAVSPRGHVLGHAPYFEEALLPVEVDPGLLRAARQRLPLLRDEKPLLTLHELSRILSEEHPHDER
ncbi:MAG: carbon-nitrogen hydrolase [Anaerolineales bacterium]